MMKMMKSLMAVGLMALVVSSISMLIPVGTDATDKDTIGIQRKWGFPIAYRRTAPGMAWAQLDGTRFSINTCSWCLLVAAGWFGVKSRRKCQQRGARQVNEAERWHGAMTPGVGK